jgi:hypothetical protein
MTHDPARQDPQGRGKEAGKRLDRSADLLWAESLTATGAPAPGSPDTDVVVEIIPNMEIVDGHLDPADIVDVVLADDIVDVVPADDIIDVVLADDIVDVVPADDIVDVVPAMETGDVQPTSVNKVTPVSEAGPFIAAVLVQPTSDVGAGPFMPAVVVETAPTNDPAATGVAEWLGAIVSLNPPALPRGVGPTPDWLAEVAYVEADARQKQPPATGPKPDWVDELP